MNYEELKYDSMDLIATDLNATVVEFKFPSQALQTLQAHFSLVDGRRLNPAQT